MKKVFVFILCIVLMCAMPIVVSAEGEDVSLDETTLEKDAPVIEPNTDPYPEEQAKTTTEMIVAWVMDNLEEISVILTLILTLFYQVRKHSLLNKSIGTINNNAVKIAENSNTSINTALTEVQAVSSVVNAYKEEMASLLAEIRDNADSKQRLEQALNEVHTHLKTAKLANMELANEVAELLVLANIPNSKKEELYSRHLAAVGAIADADKTEVKEDVEQTL